METAVMSESLVSHLMLTRTVTQVLTHLAFCVFKSNKDVSSVISATRGNTETVVVRLLENLKTMMTL